MFRRLLGAQAVGRPRRDTKALSVIFLQTCKASPCSSYRCRQPGSYREEEGEGWRVTRNGSGSSSGSGQERGIRRRVILCRIETDGWTRHRPTNNLGLVRLHFRPRCASFLMATRTLRGGSVVLSPQT
jgi:hypothetical protein